MTYHISDIFGAHIGYCVLKSNDNLTNFLMRRVAHLSVQMNIKTEFYFKTEFYLALSNQLYTPGWSYELNLHDFELKFELFRWVMYLIQGSAVTGITMRYFDILKYQWAIFISVSKYSCNFPVTSLPWVINGIVFTI